jgi:hypothetical protein
MHEDPKFWGLVVLFFFLLLGALVNIVEKIDLFTQLTQG